MQVSAVYTAFMAEAEPRLRRALVARFGMQRGGDATLDAMVYGWGHWDRVSEMQNPVGYLYRVGSSSVRPAKKPPLLAPVQEYREPGIEPNLEASLDTLTEPQRVAVVLRHSFEWTYDQIAERLDVSVSTVRTQLARGMKKLRSSLEVTTDGCGGRRRRGAARSPGSVAERLRPSGADFHPESGLARRSRPAGSRAGKR